MPTQRSLDRFKVTHDHGIVCVLSTGNAFTRIAAGHSRDEKLALFGGVVCDVLLPSVRAQ